jgi:exopolysaccharide biosynthesis protein
MIKFNQKYIRFGTGECEMKIGKWLISIVLLVALALPAHLAAQGAAQDVSKSVMAGSKKVSTSAGSRTVQFVTINLNDPRLEVRPVLARDELGRTESLAGMAKRTGALAAINGTFFMAYNKGDYKPPWGLIVIDYEKKHDGVSGSSIGFNGNALPVIDHSSRFDANSFQHVTSAGPTLVKDGKIVVNPVAEGMNDPKLTKASGQRSFIGYTANNQLVMGTVPNVTLAQLAGICQSMGLVAAMNLDGGASSGLYAHGKLLTAPGRELSNALVVVPRKVAPIQVMRQSEKISFLTPPVLIRGSIYVPTMEAFEKLGAAVHIDQQDGALVAAIEGTVIRITKQGKVFRDGKALPLSADKRTIAGTEMVPLRLVAELLDGKIEWDQQKRTATIQLKASAPER